MNRVDFSRYNHVLFVGYSLKIKYALWLFVSNIFFLTNIPYPNKLKVFILKFFGAEIGDVAIIKPWVKIKFPWNLSLGDHVWLGESCWIDNISPIRIGSHVCISQGAMLITGNHDYMKTDFKLISNKIIVDDGAWIGAKSVVTGGVHVNTHAVLSALSLTSKDLESYAIYQGNPAVKVKSRSITEVQI